MESSFTPPPKKKLELFAPSTTPEIVIRATPLPPQILIDFRTGGGGTFFAGNALRLISA